ncbi:T9SS-dependent choice-of-anchor J family protein [Aequorivita viscosa]|uniref:Por secretion system C-terminal sorting domain-containing protein n=1 Tax=Aequorivita viscosa TaxID=797419 RepID=A0A1M6CR68_9FLAO|nr:choice-of-anchor J domain-containing protein [Aequorivita viscosa]SDW39709.1 Por secretion system C-terminal sorting domain-containing protein [Aequorivita viscosa]SHI63373.1 Por secretion system C-terminal sorting domain-containing protein [Aequorivita viscosa]
MKKITLVAAMFAAFAMNAQVGVYFEDFEAQDLSGWELYDEDGDGNNWGDQFTVDDQDGNPVTPVSLISRSWLGSPLFPDNWAVTPAIDLTAASGTIELSWKVLAAAASWDNENYSVYVAASDDITVLEASPVMFTEVYDDPDDLGTQYDRTLDISSLAGQTVYVAFRHHDVSDMDFLSIDDVMVTADALSVESNEFEGFSYFVNSNVLNLSSKTPIQNISLFNMLGQEVLSQKLDSNTEAINLSGLQSSVYIATVTIDGATKSFKIVKN